MCSLGPRGGSVLLLWERLPGLGLRPPADTAIYKAAGGPQEYGNSFCGVAFSNSVGLLLKEQSISSGLKRQLRIGIAERSLGGELWWERTYSSYALSDGGPRIFGVNFGVLSFPPFLLSKERAVWYLSLHASWRVRDVGVPRGSGCIVLY